MTRFNKGSNYWFTVLFAVVILIMGMGSAGNVFASGVTVFHETWDHDDQNQWDGIADNVWTLITNRPEMKTGRMGMRNDKVGIGGIDTSSGASGHLKVVIAEAKSAWTIYLGEGDLYAVDDPVMDYPAWTKGTFIYPLPREYFIEDLALSIEEKWNTDKFMIDEIAIYDSQLDDTEIQALFDYLDPG